MNLYLNRRKKFAELMSTNSAALFLSAVVQKRNNDVEYRFRQNSSFWYLTGFNEPSAALLIVKTKQEQFKSFLFVQPQEKDKEIWTGRRAGPVAAKQQTEICEASEVKYLEEFLEKNLSGLEEFYFDFGNSHQERVLEIVQNRRIYKLTSTQNLLGELRLIKDDFEIAQMKEAAKITVQAHKLALSKAKHGINEFFIEAKIEGFFKENGADWAYPSIIASGENATILHYTENKSVLRQGELILIDAGCEKNYYASDLTRTFPIESKFAPAQKDAYNLVLKAQKAAIEQTKIKNICFHEIHRETTKILSEGLLDLGLLKGSLEEVLEKQTFRKFYMHRTSHWLGLDVHDIGSYPEKCYLKPNMVLTIEPGLYFDALDETIPAEFRGIGIRIEDDILITKDDSENLTAEMPKEIHELEQLINC